MINKTIQAVKKLQEQIFELGLARSVLSLPAPRMLALSAPTGVDAEPASVFAATVHEPEIIAVSRDLFASGHYSLAVQEAYKIVDKFVGQKAQLGISGTKLMDHVFSAEKPILQWSKRTTQSEKDEHMGYQRLFSGAMLGIRNPVTHEFNWIDDAEVALELLVFAQHLVRKAKLAVRAP